MRRLISRTVLGAMLPALTVLPLAAQEPQPSVARTVPGRRMTEVVSYARVPSRAAIGIVVDTENGATDSIGARVESVTPGGPAARAGIRAGDVITHLNGQPLVVVPPTSTTVHFTAAHPAVRMMLLSARFQPSDTVTVRYRRGQATRSARVVTEPQRDVTMWRHEVIPDRPDAQARELLERQRIEAYGPLARSQSPVQVSDLPSRALFITSPLAQLQLAPLNAELGQYFGTASGILVISAPKESGLRLRGGDVIMRIDGRAPSSPIHVIRILSSYGDGESVRLEIVRSRKRETLTGTLATAP